MSGDLKGKTLKVLVEGCPVVSFEKILEMEFNDLKDTQDRDVSKLVTAMITEGFITPFFIWKRKDKSYVIDGAGRRLALKKLLDRGVEIPDLPFVSVRAESMAQAKRFVLMVSSTHGKTTQKSFEEFVADIEFNEETVSQIALPEMVVGDIDVEVVIHPESHTVAEHERSNRKTKDEDKQHVITVTLDSAIAKRELLEELSRRGYSCK
jgi:hypothetical protein